MLSIRALKLEPQASGVILVGARRRLARARTHTHIHTHIRRRHMSQIQEISLNTSPNEAGRKEKKCFHCTSKPAEYLHFALTYLGKPPLGRSSDTEVLRQSHTRLSGSLYRHEKGKRPPILHIHAHVNWTFRGCLCARSHTHTQMQQCAAQTLSNIESHFSRG